MFRNGSTRSRLSRGPESLDQLLQHGLNALMLGGTYALLGIGLTLIFGIMRVVNFTHGELYAFGAYMMYMLVMLTGANFFVALVLAVALGRGARRGARVRAASQACAAPTSTPPCS